jgi:hypothetical protein
MGDSIDPTPIAPAVIRKSRREKLSDIRGIIRASLIDGPGWTSKRDYMVEGAANSLCDELVAYDDLRFRMSGRMRVRFALWMI